MQIFKCLKRTDGKLQGQNLIEFVFVLPLLIFITLCIFEVALFWQDVNTIYSINTEINAKAALLDPKTMNLGEECPIATEGAKIMAAKAPIVSTVNSIFTKTIMDGQEPFSLYKYTSSQIISSTGKPLATLWVDCRNPFEDGIITQIEFYHKTLIMHASIPRFDNGEAIEIIPDNIYIASPKLNTLRHY